VDCVDVSKGKFLFTSVVDLVCVAGRWTCRGAARKADRTTLIKSVIGGPRAARPDGLPRRTVAPLGTLISAKSYSVKLWGIIRSLHFRGVD